MVQQRPDQHAVCGLAGLRDVCICSPLRQRTLATRDLCFTGFDAQDILKRRANKGGVVSRLPGWNTLQQLVGDGFGRIENKLAVG